MSARNENKLFYYGLTASLICFLTGAAVYFLSQWIIVSNVKDSLVDIAKQGADRVSDSFSLYLNALESVSRIELIQDPLVPWEEKQRVIEAITKRNFLKRIRVSIADKNGYSRTSDGKMLYVGDRDYFKKAIAGSSNISDPIVSRLDKIMVIIFAVPIYHQGQIDGVLYATHSVEALSILTDDITMGNNGYAYVLNQKGETIAHPNRSLVYARDNDFTNVKKNPELKPLVKLERNMVRGMTGAGEYVYYGEKKYLGFAPIPGTTWSLAMTAPRKEAFRNLDSILWVFSLLNFVILAVFLGLNMMNLRLHKAIKEKQQFLNRAIDTASILWIELDSHGRIVAMNEHAEERLAISKDDVIQKMSLENLAPQSAKPLIDDLMKRMEQEENVFHLEFPMKKKDGSLVHLLWSATSTRQSAKGHEPNHTLMGVDITERVMAEQKLLENHQKLSKLFQDLASSEDELRHQYAQLAATQEQLIKSEERYQLAQDGSNDILWDWDARQDKVYISEKFEDFFGYSRDHYSSVKMCTRLVHPDDLKMLEEEFPRCVESEQPYFNWEFRIRTSTGNDRWVLMRGKAIYSNGQLVRMAGSLTDITERRQQDALIHQLAYYDSLTGLPNRVSLYQRCEMLFQTIPRSQNTHGALFYLDIDDFKLINDSSGHSTGDKLLIEIGLRIQSLFKGYDLFRLGGDEFVLLVTDIVDPNELHRLAEHLLNGFSAPFLIGVHIFHIRLSLGIAVFPENGASAEELLRNADTAMYRAKESGKNQCVFFNSSMNEAIMDKVQLESSLRAAIINQEFHLEFQPQVLTSTGKIVGFEALLRWKSPQYGLVSPARFIPFAEDNGLIIPIGLWVLEKACHFVNHLNRKGLYHLSVSVNISTRQLIQNDFVERVQHIIKDYGIKPGKIGLEITESVLLESFETQVEKLFIFCNDGIPIYLDDFGTGYSSLNYLMKLPINAVKIDKSFVADIKEGFEPPLIGSVIELAHQMNLRVIAEGVETPEQWQYLLANDCDLIQGFLFSRPLNEENALRAAEKGFILPDNLPLTPENEDAD